MKKIFNLIRTLLQDRDDLENLSWTGMKLWQLIAMGTGENDNEYIESLLMQFEEKHMRYMERKKKEKGREDWPALVNGMAIYREPEPERKVKLLGE